MEDFEGHLLIDVDAERAVLGEILLEPELFSMARSVLTDDDFHHPCHRAVWEAMVVAENERRVLEFRGVVDVLRTSGKLNAVGGTQFVADLSDAAPTTAHFDLHLAIVADAGAGRRTEAKLRLALAELRRPGHPGVRAAMSAAFAHVADIEMTRPDRAARHIGDVADRAFQQLEALDAGISKTPRTGLLALDGDAALGIPGMVGGFAPGAL